MINEEKVKALNANNPEMAAYLLKRNYGEYSDGYFDIFKTINNLDIRIALADYGLDKNGDILECCQFVPRGENKRGYIVLSNNTSIRRLRFNCAIMLYCAMKNQKKIATYKPELNEKSMHAAKVFAVNLLAPEKEFREFIYKKDDDGNYVYLNENGKIPFDNIGVVAMHFGIPFKTCASRILNTTNNIDGVSNSEQLMKKIKSRTYKGYIDDDMKKQECVMYSQLINSLRYLKVEKTKAITLEKILRECVKNEALLEGVIKDTKGVNYVLQVFANGGEIDENGVLHNKCTGETTKLNDDQLIVLGNYELLKGIAYEGAAYYADNDAEVVEESINKAGYGFCDKKVKDILLDAGLKYLDGSMSYKEACLFLKEEVKMKDYEIDNFMTNLLGFDHYTILRFHKTLFKYSQEQKFLRGKYRNIGVQVSGASFKAPGAREVEGLMMSLNYDIMDLLKKKDEYTNSEYIDRVNRLVVRFLRIHPFQDGNGRVSRALTNFLFKKKHLPFIFINADKQRNQYLDSLEEIDDSYDKLDSLDMTSLKIVMINAIKTSYSHIYEGNKMLTNPEKEISRSRLSNARK